MYWVNIVYRIFIQTTYFSAQRGSSREKCAILFIVLFGCIVFDPIFKSQFHVFKFSWGGEVKDGDEQWLFENIPNEISHIFCSQEGEEEWKDGASAIGAVPWKCFQLKSVSDFDWKFTLKLNFTISHFNSTCC